MDCSLRKRGWSESSVTAEKEHNEEVSPSSLHDQHRKRANTDHSEDTLSLTEKQQFLNNFPPSHQLNQSESEGEELEEGRGRKREDIIEMFGEDSDDCGEEQPMKKRRKLNSTSCASNSKGKGERIEGKKSDTKTQLLKAKSKLSKWSMRLFDPNRPRGLIETPTVIPLNDEFLKNFGKREREMDKIIGRDIDILDENLDNEIINNGNHDNHFSTEKDGAKEIEVISADGAKVKIANLAYTTSKEKITRTCEKYGPVMSVNLLMDEKNEKLSKGRAYVTFESIDDRESFIKGMNEKSLDGRIIRLTAITKENKKKSREGLGSGGLARYWEKDITTKCYRCGQVGHMAGQCPNEELARPCPFCAKIGHDSYSCPLTKICFNCGIPGHVSRECKERRGMPRRLVCGKCFISGHHRWDCRERMHDIPSYNATCFVCGKIGHFVCKPMRWFFGLKGITCFNCGEKSHHGSQCNRPLVDDCARNGKLVLEEIERAESFSLSQDLETQRKNRRNQSNDRSRQRERDNRNQKQSKIQSCFDTQTSSYGRI